MARFCDHVIALDGRYDLYPDYATQSPVVQHHALIDAAAAAGVGITLRTAPHTFKDEMAKRSMLFTIAASEGLTESDWLFVLDADEMVRSSPDREWVRHYLEHVGDDVSTVTVTLDERVDPHANPERTELSRKLPVDWRTPATTPRFFRAYNNMRVIGYHYNYVGESDGEPVELWGDDTLVQHRREWASLAKKVVIENMNRYRAQKRDEDRQSYYEKRDTLGIEIKAPLRILEGKPNEVCEV